MFISSEMRFIGFLAFAFLATAARLFFFSPMKFNIIYLTICMFCRCIDWCDVIIFKNSIKIYSVNSDSRRRKKKRKMFLNARISNAAHIFMQNRNATDECAIKLWMEIRVKSLLLFFFLAVYLGHSHFQVMCTGFGVCACTAYTYILHKHYTFFCVCRCVVYGKLQHQQQNYISMKCA